MQEREDVIYELQKSLLIGCIGIMVIFGECKKEFALESKPNKLQVL